MGKIIKKALILISPMFCFFGCVNHSTQPKNPENIKFSLKEVYFDTLRNDVGILFKIKISNKTNENFYFFSNPSFLNRDSVYSNFYLWDTIHKIRYQLFSNPSLNSLFSKKEFNLPVLMNHQVTWKDLEKQIGGKDSKVSNSKAFLTMNFLKQAHFIYVSDQRDFNAHDINLKYLIKDTILISHPKSISVYFTVPGVKDFLNDSLFRQKYSSEILWFR